MKVRMESGLNMMFSIFSVAARPTSPATGSQISTQIKPAESYFGTVINNTPNSTTTPTAINITYCRNRPV